MNELQSIFSSLLADETIRTLIIYGIIFSIIISLVRSAIRIMMPIVVILLVMVVFLGFSPDELMKQGKQLGTLGTDLMEEEDLSSIIKEKLNEFMKSFNQQEGNSIPPRENMIDELQQYYEENDEKHVDEVFEISSDVNMF